MVTNTKLISKTGDIITVTMADDTQFNIDTSTNPSLITDMVGVPMILTTDQWQTAKEVCDTMCHINR